MPSRSSGSREPIAATAPSQNTAADHGRVAEQRLLVRGERVQAGGDDRLHRVGHRDVQAASTTVAPTVRRSKGLPPQRTTTIYERLRRRRARRAGRRPTSPSRPRERVPARADESRRPQRSEVSPQRARGAATRPAGAALEAMRVARWSRNARAPRPPSAGPRTRGRGRRAAISRNRSQAAKFSSGAARGASRPEECTQALEQHVPSGPSSRRPRAAPRPSRRRGSRMPACSCTISASAQKGGSRHRAGSAVPRGGHLGAHVDARRTRGPAGSCRCRARRRRGRTAAGVARPCRRGTTGGRAPPGPRAARAAPVLRRAGGRPGDASHREGRPCPSPRRGGSGPYR